MRIIKIVGRYDNSKMNGKDIALLDRILGTHSTASPEFIVR